MWRPELGGCSDGNFKNLFSTERVEIFICASWQPQLPWCTTRKVIKF